MGSSCGESSGCWWLCWWMRVVRDSGALEPLVAAGWGSSLWTDEPDPLVSGASGVSEAKWVPSTWKPPRAGPRADRGRTS